MITHLLEIRGEIFDDQQFMKAIQDFLLFYSIDLSDHIIEQDMCPHEVMDHFMDYIDSNFAEEHKPYAYMCAGYLVADISGGFILDPLTEELFKASTKLKLRYLKEKKGKQG